MRKATLKASVVALAPNIAAISNSRTSPAMREASVNRETIDADLSKLMGGDYRNRADPGTLPLFKGGAPC
jgi:hypothetical protein